MPAIFTDLNIEQSVARYLADKFVADGYSVYWNNSKQTEGSGSTVVSFVRDFPEDPAYLVSPSETQTDHRVRVPAFSVSSVGVPKTTDADRMGIGESSFEWRSEVRVEGFAATELQWYDFAALLQSWLGHPDIRVDLRDYRTDLTNDSPAAEGEQIRFQDVDIRKQELSGNGLPNAARYFVQFAATAKYIE